MYMCNYVYIIYIYIYVCMDYAIKKCYLGVIFQPKQKRHAICCVFRLFPASDVDVVPKVIAAVSKTPVGDSAQYIVISINIY